MMVSHDCPLVGTGEEEKRPVKLVIVGDGAVGKTSLVLSYTGGHIQTDYEPTLYDSFTVAIPFEGTEELVTVVDTAGQDTYDRMRAMSYYDADLFIVCYTVDSQDSLDNVKTKWVPEIREYRQGTPFILVGTQTDLRGSLVDITDSCTTTHQGKKMARKLGARAFCETSALDNFGVYDMFVKALAIVHNGKLKENGWKSFKNLFRRKSMKV